MSICDTGPANLARFDRKFGSRVNTLMDTLTATQRSAQMSKVRSLDTKPEMHIRRLVFSMGYRFRLHRRDIPGCPDLAFIAKRKVIFVHGCFWHRHNCKAGRRLPKTRVDFWETKLRRNKQRDRANKTLLGKRGWSSLTVWECEIRREESLSEARSTSCLHHAFICCSTTPAFHTFHYQSSV